MTRSRLFYPAAVALAAVAAAVLPAGQAVAGPAADSGAKLAACTWRLDTRLPLPAGLTSGTVAATDGALGFAGTAQNRSVDDLFHAVVWRGVGRGTLLPTPAGSGSMAFGMNRLGDVVGAVIPAEGPSKPALWRGGRLFILGTASAETHANARDINDAGLIVGEASEPSGDTLPIAWSADVPDKFSYVRSPSPQGFLAAVTENGVLAGNVLSTSGTPIRQLAAAGTLAAGLHTLPEAAAGTSSTVWAASGSYLAGVFNAVDEIESHAVLWRDEVPQVLSKRDTSALGVNSQGTAVGYDAETGAPLIWAGGTERELPVLTPGQVITSAVGQVVTEDGTAVGGWINSNGGDSRPVLWHCR